MTFLPIFDVRVTHSYYADGRCPDFVFDPTPGTQKVLRGHRCRLRARLGGIRVLTAVDDQGKPFITMTRNTTFDFQLRLHNADFPLFTDLSAVHQRDAPLYTSDGAGRDGRLALVSRTATFSETFMVAEPASAERFTLRGRPMPGSNHPDFTVESSARIDRVKEFDGADKVITVDTRSAKRGDTFAVRYPIQPRLGQGVFADLEIHAADILPQIDDPSAGSRDFRITFAAKRARWTYYYVTDSNKRVEAYRIVDASPSGSVPPIEFAEQNRRDLNENPDPADEVAANLAEQYPELRRFRFHSNDLVACRQAPARRLELHVDGNRLSAALPNPSLQNYNAIEVPVDKASQRQDSLYQVVKYLTHSFSKTGV